jgi:dTDP-4-amino-4,6-dideoxygalactose transaminase
MKVEFYRHHLGEDEFRAVRDVMTSPFLTAGPKTIEFERRFAEYLNAKHVVGLNSCTAALFLALKALDLKEGDEVIVPAMTFIASANVVLHCGAKPVIVDVEADTGLLDVKAVESAITARTRAVIAVHLYGQMVDIKALKSVSEKHKFAVIEDAAHAVEAVRDGVRPGELGDCAAFSFYATKNLTCGEGGALSTNGFEMNEKVRVLRQHGMSKSAAERYHNNYQHWDMVDLGYKYNMFDIQAAMLIPQLANLEELLKRRHTICAFYESRFTEAGIEFPVVKAGARSARHLFTVWAPEGRRDEILKKLQEKQIGVAVNYRAIHLLTYYREHYGFKPGMFPSAERIGDRTMTIPLYPSLTDAEVEYVAKCVVTCTNN